MPRDLESWGGPVHVPWWLRPHRPADPGDSDEKRAEDREPRPERSDRTVLENADLAGGLAWLFYDRRGGRRDPDTRR